MPLNSKTLKFIHEYIVDFNGTRAYKAAGFKPKSEEAAASAASRMLRNVKVLAAVESLREELLRKSGLTAQMIIDELRTLGFWNIQDFLDSQNQVKDLTTLPRSITKPVASIKVKTTTMPGSANDTTILETTVELKLHDKRAALVDLGRHLGIFEKDNNQTGRKIIVRRT